MPHRTQSLCKVRTVTMFLTLSPEYTLWPEVLNRAATDCRLISEALINDGYEVQTVRIVTNPFGEYLQTHSLAAAREGLNRLQQLISSLDMPQSLRIRLAIGEARTLGEVALLPSLISEFGDLCNVCVNVSQNNDGVLDHALINASAKAVQEISELTPRGEGNFNFTVNFNCQPLIPYFPAAYYHSDLPACFVIGLETPDLLVHTLQRYHRDNTLTSSPERYGDYFRVMRDALQYHLSRIQTLIAPLAANSEFQFAGFDSSAAPSKSCASMAEVYQAMGVEYFGASGTVEASALLTRVFKSMEQVDLVGFSGLMLALTEDTGLAAGSKQSHFDIRSLLTYSAVCGIGLDTVPIPGDTPLEKITALMRDTGTMAYRLNKPLTVRLFPVPGLSAGDITAFESDDLCNCAVLAVP